MESSDTENPRKETNVYATAQGHAYESALNEMRREATSDSQEVGDFIITIACEKADGMYYSNGSNDDLIWKGPENSENQHIDVIVQDRKDQRFIPHLDISCSLLNEHRTPIVKLKPAFGWHPFLYHYGMNFSLPYDGVYFFEVRIARPLFGRHDKLHGKRYGPCVASLGPLSLQRGRKTPSPE